MLNYKPSPDETCLICNTKKETGFRRAVIHTIGAMWCTYTDNRGDHHHSIYDLKFKQAQ